MTVSGCSQSGSTVTVSSRYENYIGGDWVPPVKGEYFENPSPVNGKSFTEVARGTSEDIELALDAAHGAAPAWGRTSPTERALILNKIADRMEANLEMLAIAECWENGKPVRECLAADIPLAIDHFRYFAGCIRAQEGGLTQLDEETVANLAAGFEQAVADSIGDRTRRAIDAARQIVPGVTALVVAGGVAANQRLRGALAEVAARAGLPLVAPPIRLCTDNAAMIAWAGLEHFQRGETDALDFAPRPRWPLDSEAPALRGAGVKA